MFGIPTASPPLQNGLKCFRSLRRGVARLRNIERIGGFGDGAGGGGGFVSARLSAAIDTAILCCARSSARTSIPVRNREAGRRGVAIFPVTKRLGFDCRKREPLSV